MFAHERNPQGLSNLGAVAMVIALWLVGVSLALTVYLQGGVRLPLCGN
jgi:hypothetical protein